MMDFAVASPYTLPQFENIRTLRILAKKERIKAACHNFRAENQTKSERKFLLDQSDGAGRRNFLNLCRVTN
jgi:hypothetical protein